MTGARRLAGLVLMVIATIGTAAEEASMAVRPEAFLSSDADDNEVRKMSLGWDWRHSDRDHWTGVDVQQVRFSDADWSHSEQRVYGRAASTLGTGAVTDATWRWRVKLGSNGHTALGSIGLNTEGPNRREIFFEREALETRAGVERRQMYNFAGAAFDQPFNTRTSGTVLAGLQTFGDGNERIHLRGNLVFSAVPEQGLSLQVRSRYYHNSDPYLGGYYSPEWYGEALGVLALRRVVHGYTWRGVAGLGRQRNADEGWKRARLLEFGFESPRWRQSWLRLVAGYTDTPVATSSGTGSYSYRYGMLEAVAVF